jgi:hypothetical protein
MLLYANGRYTVPRPWWAHVLPPPYWFVVLIPRPHGGDERPERASVHVYPWRWLAIVVYSLAGSVWARPTWALGYVVEVWRARIEREAV